MFLGSMPALVWLEVPGLDVSGLDVSGLDVSGLDVSGLDVSGLDVFAEGLEIRRPRFHGCQASSPAGPGPDGDARNRHTPSICRA